jgi:uncharacterized protein YciI
MTQVITLRSLEELGQFADVIVAHETIATERALVLQGPMPAATLDLGDLVETIRRSAEELQAISVADAQARKQAEEALATYRRLTADAGHLDRIACEAQGVAGKAATFAAEAFAPESREGAARVAEAATLVASEARDRLRCVTVEAETLGVRDDVARLIAEERDREDTARREAEERNHEERLAQEIAEADALVRAGNFDEALRRLGCLAKEHPNSPALASCIDNVRRRNWAVKTTMAERALREARRSRRDPQAILALLEPLDLTSVPDALARQVYGCWLKGCSRLRHTGALHYSTGFCKGAVMVPSADGRLEVVSAMGLQGWDKGRRFSPTALKGARPLK